MQAHSVKNRREMVVSNDALFVQRTALINYQQLQIPGKFLSVKCREGTGS
jgi:hypothetical protein